MKKILLFCDHPLTMNGLEMLLNDNIGDVVIKKVIGFQTLTEDLTDSSYVQIIILDNGKVTLDFYLHILSKYPSIPILLLIENMPVEFSMTLYKKGILGILPISSNLDTILAAVHQVMARQFVMTNEFKRYLVSGYPKSSTIVSQYLKLTNREAEVASLLLTGKGLSEVGKIMNLKISTIGTFKSRIFKKLRVNNLFELASVVNRNKFLLQDIHAKEHKRPVFGKFERLNS